MLWVSSPASTIILFFLLQTQNVKKIVNNVTYIFVYLTLTHRKILKEEKKNTILLNSSTNYQNRQIKGYNNK